MPSIGVAGRDGRKPCAFSIEKIQVNVLAASLLAARCRRHQAPRECHWAQGKQAVDAGRKKPGTPNVAAVAAVKRLRPVSAIPSWTPALYAPRGARRPAAPGACAHVLPLCKAIRVGAQGNKGASTRLHQSCGFMQSCEEFGELASLLAAKGEPFAIHVSRCAGRAYRSSWRGSAAASLHDCYSLTAKLHTVFTPPTLRY